MKFTSKSALLSLLAYMALTFFLIYITDHYILTINFYESSGDLVSAIPDQEQKVYESLQQWIYISSAVYLVIKFCLISLTLYTGLYLFDRPVAFSKIFQVTVLAEFIFFIPAIFKIFWFHFMLPNGTLIDWHKFYFLSALSLFNNVAADWSYALQTLNIFEVGYWFLLAYGIFKTSNLTYDQSLKIVICSYVPTLLIWVASVTFFTLLMFSGTA